MQPIPLPVAPSKPPVNASLRRLEIGLASPAERELIYRMRHEVYAREIGQHAVHPSGRLTDSLDAGNIYIAARSGGILSGFISITPPGIGTYSID